VLAALEASKSEMVTKTQAYENTFSMLEKSNILNCRIAFSGNESVEKIKLDTKKQL
jgi:hypothetical protein